MAADERFDAVVIGSGFGGAVTACRLAEAGWSVVVLERGRPWPPGSFPRTPRDFQQAFWDPAAGRYGMADIWSFSGMNVVTASGLGGGSLIYSNVMLRKPAATFEDSERERWPVTRAQLDVHYDRVQAVQAPQVYPLEHEPYAQTGRAQELARAARALGLEAERPPLAVLFAAADGADPVPRAPVVEEVVNLHGVPRTTCRLCGECNIGCNDGAKQTLDLTYLTRALAAGAQIRTLCEARTLAASDGGWTVGYRQHVDGAEGVQARLRDPVADAAAGTVHGAHVVLGAGTVGSVSLLLRNRPALPRLSRAIGRRVSGNGDLLSFARNARGGHPRDAERPWRYLDPSRGPAITTSVHVPAERSESGREHYVQDSGAPAFTEWMWQALELPEDLWAARRMVWRRAKEKLTGRRDENISAELATLMGSGRMSAAMMPLLGMGRDVADARLHRDDDGELDLEWDDRASRPHYDALRATCGALSRAMGADWMPIRSAHLTTVHAVGGCAMAVNPADGVVDPLGNVHGHPGLHVADGSVMPGPVGPNPSFTIAALADRFAEAMIAGGRP